MKKRILKAVFGAFLLSFLSGCEPSNNNQSDTPVVEDIKVTGISFFLTNLDATDNSMYMDQTSTIVGVTVEPSNATNKEITFYVENPTIASVSNKIITPLEEGSTFIIGKALDGSNTTFKVPLIVKERKAESISISISRNTFFVGETVDLTVIINPQNIKNPSYEIVQDGECLSIDGNKVTGIQKGTSVICAKTLDGSNLTSNYITVNVNAPIPTSITCSCDKQGLKIGDTTQINTVVYPLDADEQIIRYQTASGTSSVISVSSTGLVTAKAVGTEKVIVSLVNYPTVKTEIEFTVSNIEPTSISATLSTSIIYIGDTVTLSVFVTPSNAFTKQYTFNAEHGSTFVDILNDGRIYCKKSGTETLNVYLVERPNIKTTVSLTILDSTNPTDPFEDDVFEGV